ncbi:hypothetical protein GCM10027516_18370 [Niabella aquatica]
MRKGKTINKPKIKAKENLFLRLKNGNNNNNKGIYIAAAAKRGIPNGEQVTTANMKSIRRTNIFFLPADRKYNSAIKDIGLTV